MQKSLPNFIQQKNLFSLNDTILIAVSGGVDSVVLCDLFSKSKIKFAIAHCNFTLRNKESDEDAEFVETLSEKYNVPFHFISFPTSTIAKQKKESIQVAARNLRYEWFEKIRKEFKYDYIATAHHQNDSIETFFINLLRGSGIKGLTGISNKNGKIIRPLLFAAKEEILNYAKKNKLKFREDSSNASDKYVRNKIRLKLIPLLKEINPQAEQTISNTIQHLNEVEHIYNTTIETQRKKLVKEKANACYISIPALLKINPINCYLFEFLKPFDFNSAQTAEIIEQLKAESGKQFYSSTHRLIKDRTQLIIEPIHKEETKKEFIVTKKSKQIITDDIQLRFSIKEKMSISPSSKIGCIDFNKLLFPLTVRKWEKGDAFYPLGMKGKKKLSDFFTDKKLSISDKENVWLLTSNNEIVWIIGHRIDDRFKITDKTSKIYFVELVK